MLIMLRVYDDVNSFDVYLHLFTIFTVNKLFKTDTLYNVTSHDLTSWLHRKKRKSRES